MFVHYDGAVKSIAGVRINCHAMPPARQVSTLCGSLDSFAKKGSNLRFCMLE